MSTANENVKLVCIKKPACFESPCFKEFAFPNKLRSHLVSHNIVIPPLTTARKYQNNDKYVYVKDNYGNLNVHEHHGCPACKYHCEQLSELRLHFYKEHPETVKRNGSNVHNSSEPIQEISTVESPHTSNSTDNDNGILEKEKLNGSGFHIHPPSDERMMVGAFDVSNAFYNLQLSITNSTWKYTLENHVHLAMTLSYILLLSPNQCPDLPFFNDQSLTATINHVKNKYGFQRDLMPLIMMTDTVEILDKLDAGIIHRDKAIQLISELNVDQDQKKILDAIAALIKKLPKVNLDEKMSESEEICRFIEPLLTGLFDDPENGIYLRILNQKTLEFKKKDTLSKQHPDITISKEKGACWTVSCGYGEVKPTSEESNNYLISIDLVRVAIFCKNALDEHNMKGTLGIQVVGNTVTFYVLTLPAEGLYVFYEIAAITVPKSIHNLTKLLMDIPQMLLVLNIFQQICNQSTESRGVTSHRPTITMETFNDIFSTSKDKSRACYLNKRRRD